MRNSLIAMALFAVASTGCSRFIVKTQSRVGLEGPVDTRITDFSPVSPIAGPLKPVVVEPGKAGRIAVLDVDGLILNTPFVGPMSLGENPVALFRWLPNQTRPSTLLQSVSVADGHLTVGGRNLITR